MKRTFLVLAVLLFLTSVTWALSIEKTVSGPELIGLDEALEVELTITSTETVQVEQLVDPIPFEFVAMNYPSSCEMTEVSLICNIGQGFSGTSKITYELIAISTGYGMIGGPTLSYEGGVKTTDFFRQYFVGKPKLSIEVEGGSTFLPEDALIQTVLIRNSGIRAVNEAEVQVAMGTYNYSESISLNPEEILRLNLNMGSAPASGSEMMIVNVKWGNSTETSTKTLLFVSPSLDASRSVSAEWKLVDKVLTGYVSVIYTVKNNGTAVGNFSFSSGEQFTLQSGETKLIEMEYSESAPGEKISLKDERGNIISTQTFTEETPEVNKGFFVLMYEHVASSIPLVILIAGGLASIYFATRFKSNLMKLGLMGLSAVCWLLVASYFSVGAVKIPAVISRML